MCLLLNRPASNTPLHASLYIEAWLASKDLQDEKLITPDQAYIFHLEYCDYLAFCSRNTDLT